MTDQIAYTIGIPYPMGASTQGRNLNIAVVMHPKKECGILLYKSVETGEEEIRIPFTEEYAVGDVYCISFSGLDSRKYTYLFYEDDRIFVDPYATRVVGNEKWHPYVEGYSKEKEIHLRSGVAEDSFDWKNDHKPKTPFSDSILYCLHVRGFTIDPSSKVRGKGTFTGIIEKIPYLLELGITAIELMPAYEFLEDSIVNGLTKKGMEYADIVQRYKDVPGKDQIKTVFNYWGYQEGYYFAPKASYAHTKDPVKEFQTMVHALHEAGIEVIMQFYFPKTVVAADILVILKYWVYRYHVDGFRLKGAEVPFYLIAKDPMFSQTKLMYDDVPEHLIYPNGVTPEYKNIAYCSDDFANLYRRYLKGDNDCLYQFTNLNRSVPNTIGAIRTMANYYGFRMYDMVSYEQKHNEANGENNADGVRYNYSWNCGVEGETRKKSVLDLRMKQMKNALSLLFLAQGTPFLVSGDEFAKSQEGNNNPYNQDNRISWLNWKWSKKQQEVFEFTKALIRLRKSTKSFRRDGRFGVSDQFQCGYPDISYHGDELWRVDMAEYNHHIGLLYVEQLGERSQNTECVVSSKKNSNKKGEFAKKKHPLRYIYVLYNMHWNEHTFALPPLRNGTEFVPVLFTGGKKEQFLLGQEEDRKVSDQNTNERKETNNRNDKKMKSVTIPERSILILMAEES